MKYLITLCLSIFVVMNTLLAHIDVPAGAYIYSVKAKKGDGISMLLQRYELNSESVNIEAFYELNDLSKNDILHFDREYKLPVFIFKYDGSSIRSSIGINDYDRALRIQKYNEAVLAKAVRSTHYTASKILWVPFHEYSISKKNSTEEDGEKVEKLEEQKTESIEISKSIKVSYLGKQNESIKIKSQELANRVFYVVSGHGGHDPGAMCTDCAFTLCEDEYAYDVAARVAKNLLEQGAIVEMVIQDKKDGIRNGPKLACDKDERLADGSKLPYKHLDRLIQRTDYINKKYNQYKKQGVTDQRMVSIHVDANSKSHNQDVFFCYYKNSANSLDLARKVFKTFKSKYEEHQKNRGYDGRLSERGLYVLRKTSPPAILIELGNINNKKDHKRILNDDNREALAKWIAEGIAK